jgi:glucan biosynthesis protein C
MRERRYDIDWMRVIAMLTVFVFHCTRFFCTEDWQLKVPVDQQSSALPIIRELFIAIWFMQMFCLVSGFATRYSLSRRTGGQYLLERVKRLLIPLYTVGLFIMVVPQNYFDDFTHGRTTQTFWQWLPSYYLGLPTRFFAFDKRPLVDPVNLVPYSFSGHLWFIQMLFLITLVTLPLILYLKSENGTRFVDRLAGWVLHPGGIFLFVIPLAIGDIALRWFPVTTERSWADFVRYALFFVIGFIFAGDSRFTDSVKKHGWLSLALWFLVFLVFGALFTIVLKFDTSDGQGFSLLFVLWHIIYCIISWSAVVFLLSLGAKYLTFSNKFLTYSNEAVLPFFIFHQTIIQIVGWFVLPLEMGNLAKFLIIAAISFPLILFLYEVFVRHIGFMRFLFGMTPQKKQPAGEPRLRVA